MVYLLPLLAGIVYGIGGLLNKRVTNLFDNPVISSLLFNFASLIVSCFLLVDDLNNKGIFYSNNSFDWILIIISVFLTIFSFAGMFASMRELPVSEQILLSRASILTYTLGGFLILGETVTGYKLLGLLFVLLGILLSSIREGKFVFNKWVIVQLLSSVGFGITVLIDKEVSYSFSTGLYVLINIFGTTLALVIWSILNKSFKEIKKIPKQYLLTTLLSGGLTVIAFYLIIKSYEYGGFVILSGALGQLKIPIVVIGGYLFFNERKDLLPKFLGVITVIIGLILLKL